MTEFTEKLNLEKPAQTDFYNVDVQNSNMDKIEIAVLAAGMNPETEGIIADINTKIGNTTDTPSSSTTVGSLFAKVNYLVSQINSYLANIYNYAMKIGNANDAGGTTTAGTIFAKLNAIFQQFLSNWTVARANKLDYLNDTITSRASQASMNEVKVLETSIDTRIGLTTDTGGTATAGTIMGKQNKTIQQTVPNSRTKKITTTYSGTIAKGGTVSGTGEGVLSFSSFAQNRIVKIVLDGNAPITLAVPYNSYLSVYYNQSFSVHHTTQGTVSYITQT